MPLWRGISVGVVGVVGMMVLLSLAEAPLLWN
jgi:hypothetical protein